MNKRQLMIGVRKMILPALVTALIVSVVQKAEAREDWGITLFGAVQATGDMGNSMVAPDFEKEYSFAALGLSRKVYSLTTYIDLEVEGLVLKHMGKQYHEEFDLLLVARWLTFPWNRYIETTFAVGNGLSYSTEKATLEERLYGEKTSNLVNGMMFEWTFDVPSYQGWSLVWRFHHRSGVYGLYDGVRGAANAMGIGLKYRF
jgi:hypothetical protein